MNLVGRYLFCGMIGTGDFSSPENPIGTIGNDPFRPEVADEVTCAWAANQEYPNEPRFCVWLSDDTVFDSLVYDKINNPNGFDWIEVFDTGDVIVHASE